MIRKVLVANRGEIAIRIFHTLREMAIQSVAVYTDADESALHTRSADERRRISSYLDAAVIVQAAKDTEADAVHPGYGFLSEATSLSSACEAAGLIFIGPSTETIRVMGDKLESKRLMEGAGVPVPPMWNDKPPETEYPVLVKAVGGGGGKGMRLVQQPAELADALASASREAAKAFADDRVFVEKYIQNPRHIEFQILGDVHGHVVHVFERECSIQRRHQKIIEETPSVAVTPTLRKTMGDAAVRAAQAVGYRGAGTVEFALDTSGRFYFLEMNTRLQVEHAITEMVAGLDLVREQIRLAEGKPLSWAQSDLRQIGHAIECRIYAEVPEQQFRPSTGEITVYEPPSGPGIRVDSGVTAGTIVGIDYDPMLAKLIVWANSRKDAIDRMSSALRGFAILGVENNIEFLGRVISSEDYVAGSIDTHFIERHAGLLRESSLTIPAVVLLAASLSGPAVHGASSQLQNVWRSGSWRNT